MSRVSLSKFQAHVRKWGECKLCHYAETRAKVCLARGKLPCDVLLIGEAPGYSENATGAPFIGPAGKLLDRIVERALEGLTDRWAFTNLVACIPLEGGSTGAEKLEAPEDGCVTACQPRLKEMVELADPKLLVAVGNEARDWLDPTYKYGLKLARRLPQVHVVHPAAILRFTVVQQGLAFQRCVVAIRNAWLDVVEGETEGAK